MNPSALNRNSYKMLIIDDDAVFGSVLKRAASAHGFDVRYVASLLEMGSFAQIRDFDIVVSDYFLEALRGDEIAQYAEVFFDGGIPIVMVSAQPFCQEAVEGWPPVVKGFVPKAEGIEKILETVDGVLEREKKLAFLRQKPNERGATSQRQNAKIDDDFGLGYPGGVPLGSVVL